MAQAWSAKKSAKKQKRQRKAKDADPIWKEIDKAVLPSRPVQTPAFTWGGLKQRTTRATSDEALAYLLRSLLAGGGQGAALYEDTMRYADGQDFDWNATGGPR